MPTKKIDIMERSKKDMAKELMFRIEKIESSASLGPTDREMLQALNARLAVCDLQTMRLAEFRDLEVTARSEKSQEIQKPAYRHEKSIEELSTTAPAALRQAEGLTTLARETDHGAQISRETNNDFAAEGQGSDCEDASTDDDDDDERSEVDESGWPLLYRILALDPKISADDMSLAADRYVYSVRIAKC